MKWMFAESLPIAASALFVVFFVVVYLYKRCCLRRTRRLTRHRPILVAMFLVMFYYLYL